MVSLSRRLAMFATGLIEDCNSFEEMLRTYQSLSSGAVVDVGFGLPPACRVGSPPGRPPSFGFRRRSISALSHFPESRVLGVFFPSTQELQS